MSEIKLVVIDFDGTLMGRHDEFPLYSAFKQRIDNLRARYGALWAVSTGRSSKSFWRRFTSMALAGIEPDFIVTRHAFISGRSKNGFRSHFLWNLNMFYKLWQVRSGISFVLEDLRKLVASSVRGAHIVHKDSERLCIRFDNQESCDAAYDLIQNNIDSNSHLMAFRYLSEIDVRSVPFTKGLVVSELARHLKVDPSMILTIGNGHNDISMFSPDVSGMAGCPANSDAEVIQAVNALGGHIASKPALAGVIEIIDAFENGSVSSALPGWWQNPDQLNNPYPIKRSGRKWTKYRTWKLLMFFGIVYIVFVVFANYGLLPFSDLIMFPFRLLSKLIEKMSLLCLFL